jgi:tRNA pseudouridine55 synthase
MARKTTYRHKHNMGTTTNDTPKPIYPKLTAAQQAPYLEGEVLMIDKPLHWTSFDVVRKLRNLLQIKKIGHAGTLDPLATGLLIVCTGKFTKKINEYMAAEKTYSGSITLGAVTPTYDLESQPQNPLPYQHITEAQLIAATQPFTGAIWQKPPIFSAIKKDGVALYELARRGEEVDLQPRAIVISSFTITRWQPPVADFLVQCSTGTYIRSLAHDFGQALGCGAYLSALRREQIGNCKVNDALSMEQFEKKLYPVI